MGGRGIRETNGVWERKLKIASRDHFCTRTKKLQMLVVWG